MFLDYWGLKEEPFRNTPDPRFFYRSRQHEEALSKMLYAVQEGFGAAMLTGVFGCGKTVISYAIYDELSNDRYQVAIITNPQLDHVEILRAIVRSLKAVELPAKRTELSADAMLEILGNILEHNYSDGRKTIVVVDEAHIINDERVFEELRLIMNFQKKDRFLLTLLLFGQPELKQKVEDIKQLEQRIAVKCHLEPFDEKDTRDYIIHRLRVAGKERPPFDEDGFKAVYKRSSGIPRRINQICHFALLTGFEKQAKSVDDKIIEEGLILSKERSF